MNSRFYSIEEIISREQSKIDEIEKNLNSEFIPDLSCPGGFRKPDKYDRRVWKESLKYYKSIVKYLKEEKNG